VERGGGELRRALATRLREGDERYDEGEEQRADERAM